MDLPIRLTMGYLGTGESLVIFPLPGSRIAKTFMNGDTDQALNFEIAMKSKTQSKIHATLWELNNNLEQISDITSNDNSFEFDEITITNKPFINQIDEQGWFVFLLDIQAKITVLKGD